MKGFVATLNCYLFPPGFLFPHQIFKKSFRRYIQNSINQ